MNKPYILIATVNGHDLPTKGYKSYEKAYAAFNRLMDIFNLQVEDSYTVGSDDVYRMEQYRSWVHILHNSCNA